MGQDKWDFNTAWDWVRPYPGIGVLYGNDDPANIIGAPAYTEKEYLNEVNWKDEKGREDFQAFIDGRDVEDWKNTRFLSTLTPGMEFGSGANSYKIISGTDKRLIPNGYKVVGTLDDAYRPGYRTGPDDLFSNRESPRIAGVNIPGYTIIQKTEPETKQESNINYKPIDFEKLGQKSGLYVKRRYIPTSNTQMPDNSNKTRSAGKYMMDLAKNQSQVKDVSSTQFDDLLQNVNDDRSLMV